jgi:hypothetical protein
MFCERLYRALLTVVFPVGYVWGIYRGNPISELREANPDYWRSNWHQQERCRQRNRILQNKRDVN